MATMGTTSDSGQACICMKLISSSHNPSGQVYTAMDESKTEYVFFTDFKCNNYSTVKIAYSLLSLWRKVLLEKLIHSHLVKKFPTFYGTQGFITTFT
jgi:hypothetical protein